MPIPNQIIEEFNSLPNEEKFQILDEISNVAFSPIQLLHLINLAFRTFTFEDDKELELTANLIDLFFENEKNVDNNMAFQRILGFVKDEFKYRKGADKWSSEIFLAMTWAHSCRIFNILCISGLTPDDIISSLDGKDSPFPETLNRTPEIWNDCTHPRHVNKTKFLTHAAAKLFSGINLELLEKFKVPDFIKANILTKEDEESLSYTLYNDPTLCRDGLHSIFAGDRFETLSPLIGSEGIEILKSENSKQNTKEILEQFIKTPEEFISLIYVYLIADALPIYPELKELFIEAVRRFDLTKLFKQDIENPPFLLMGAAEQIPFLNDGDLRLFFRNIILDTAKMIANEENQDKIHKMKSSLTDVVLAFSYHPGNPALSNEYFVTLLEEIINIWRDMDSNYRYSFSNLIWELPIGESKAWREFNLKIRTNL